MAHALATSKDTSKRSEAATEIVQQAASPYASCITKCSMSLCESSNLQAKVLVPSIANDDHVCDSVHLSASQQLTDRNRVRVI